MTDKTNIEHFLALARRGRRPAASSGEWRAHRLAYAILDHAPGLDEQAIAGAVEFLRLAAESPNRAAEMLEATEGE